MAEFLAPGVFIEETSFRSKTIEGVATTTTGMIGPAAFGPVDVPGPLLTSLGEFERTYGPGNQLTFSGSNAGTLQNYLWHAARAFFFEGGKRLYVVRTYRRPDASGAGVYSSAAITETAPATGAGDGHARGALANQIRIRARYPGTFGDFSVTFTVTAGQNVVGSNGGVTTVGALFDGDIVVVYADPQTSVPVGPTFYQAKQNAATGAWTFVTSSGTGTQTLDQVAGLKVRVVTVSVTVTPVGGPSTVYSGLAVDPAHVRAGVNDSLFGAFGWDSSHPAVNQDVPIVISWGGSSAVTAFGVLGALTQAIPGPTGTGLALNLANNAPAGDRSATVVLTGGADGVRPVASDYEGAVVETTGTSTSSVNKTGLEQMKDFDDVSILAAPGSTFLLDGGYNADAVSIVNLLINHATNTKAIAVIDSGSTQTITQVRAFRAKIDSTYAALYYPWVLIQDPITNATVALPPSGFVAGIYARNDVTRAVFKAPANEVVNLALGFETVINTGQQEVLNPEGINAFRFFPGRGNRLWGARTISSDPEWKYVNVRRYFLFLERSIERGTQFAVFEPNGEALWANVRRTISDFLLNEWQSGALLGDKPEKAFFVRCDRTTMTQNDLDNGRLIVLIGVAPLKPAEFVIFRIGQWTADAKL